MHEYRGARCGLGCLEEIVGEGQTIFHQFRGNGKIPKYKFIALLGDLRRGGDVDDEGDAALFGDLRDRRRSAGVERADETMRAFLDQPLGARARGIDVGLRVGVHQLDLDAERVSQHCRRQIGALLTRLADQALKTRLGQQHADFEFGRLGARDIEWRQRGDAGADERSIELSAVQLSGHRCFSGWNYVVRDRVDDSTKNFFACRLN